MTAKELASDEEYEATRLKYYPNDPKQGKPVRNQRGNYAVEEVVHHGDYRHVRMVEVTELNARNVTAILRSSPYAYNLDEDSPQMARVLTDLLLGRVNRSHGWSTFRVVHISQEPDFSLHIYDDYRNEGD